MRGDRPLHIVDWYDGVLSGCWVDDEFRYLAFHHVVVWEINKFRIALEFESSTDEMLPLDLRELHATEVGDATYDQAWTSYCRAHHNSLIESMNGSVIIDPILGETLRFERLGGSTWGAIKGRFAPATADLDRCTEAGWGSFGSETQEHRDWLLTLLTYTGQQ